MYIGFVLSTKYKFGASLICRKMPVTASLCTLSILNKLAVERSGVNMLVYEDNPKMKGEQKLTHPMNLLNSALDVGMVCVLKTCFRFSNIVMVWPFLIVIPNQSICRVIKTDFSALTKIPAC